MTDKMTLEQRHKCMASIKGKDTKPEMLVRRYLFAKGYRFRLHVKSLPGKPDIVLRKYRTVIMINGCFWHGHENCSKYRLPKTNTEFWAEKIRRNRDRDKKGELLLRVLGWHVINIWECELTPSKLQATLLNLEITLNGLFIKNYSIDPTTTSNVAEDRIPYGKRSVRCDDKAHD